MYIMTDKVAMKIRNALIQKSSLKEYPQLIIEWRFITSADGGKNGVFKCHCGSRLRYAHFHINIITNELIRVGSVCSSHMNNTYDLIKGTITPREADEYIKKTAKTNGSVPPDAKAELIKIYENRVIYSIGNESVKMLYDELFERVEDFGMEFLRPTFNKIKIKYDKWQDEIRIKEENKKNVLRKQQDLEDLKYYNEYCVGVWKTMKDIEDGYERNQARIERNYMRNGIELQYKREMDKLTYNYLELKRIREKYIQKAKDKERDEIRMEQIKQQRERDEIRMEQIKHQRRQDNFEFYKKQNKISDEDIEYLISGDTDDEPPPKNDIPESYKKQMKEKQERIAKRKQEKEKREKLEHKRYIEAYQMVKDAEEDEKRIEKEKLNDKIQSFFKPKK
jgi:hypothetical protein